VRYALRALGLTLCLIAVALPGSASASVRFGATLSNNADTTLACFNAEPDCSTVQTVRPESQRAGSPISGVVVMWRTRPAVNGDITFQVVRRNGVGDSRVVASDTESAQQDTVNEFFVRIPIHEGDLLGLNAAGSSEPMRASTGAQVARFVPPLGSDFAAPKELVDNTELLVNATVEPDADGDGFGDDSQDSCPTNAATQGACSGTLVGPLLNDELEWGVDLRFNQNVTFASAAASPNGLMMPSDGVIVRWRIRPESGAWMPQVLRPDEGGTYRSVATGDRVEAGAPHDKPGFPPYIRSFPARLPVKAGDILAFKADAQSETVAKGGGGGGGSLLVFTPPLADGESRAPSSQLAHILAVNADLEPDADGDGFGDITQDGCPASAATQGTCPPEPPPPPAPPPPPLVTLNPFGVANLSGRSLRYDGGRVLRIPMACPATTERCRGVLEARATVTVPTAAARRTIRLGRVRFSIPGGERRVLALRLSKPARRALRSARRVRVSIVITAAGPGRVRRSLPVLRPSP